MHRDQLERVAAELLRRETLDGGEFYRLVGKEMPAAKESVPALPVAASTANATSTLESHGRLS